MDKIMIGYFWLLSVLGAVYFGHEFGITKADYLIMRANKQTEQCNALLGAR